MNLVLRGVRVVDPLSGRDEAPLDVWVRDGRLVAIDRRVDASFAQTVDLGRPEGRERVIVCPGFVDLHAHLREPGEEAKETLASGAAAAAAGGFTQVVAMANTRPPIDTPPRVAAARARADRLPVAVQTAAALTRGLSGAQLVDIAGCAAAGAAAFTDDGRNAAPVGLLAEGLRAASRVDRAVLVHPEDEATIRAANLPGAAAVRCPERPAEAERLAVERALEALAASGHGRLHLQHLSCAEAVALVARARDRRAGTLTAEVTPHHLAMWLPLEEEPSPPALRKVNPPLRAEPDRTAMIAALRDGVVDAIATDHAPHRLAEKAMPYGTAPAGMVGLETAFAVCATLGGMGGAWLPVLVERLTAGPYSVLGEPAGLAPPRLRVSGRADLAVVDPEAEWTVTAASLRSRSQNTPFLGARLRGRVLLTIADGAVAHVLEGSPLDAGLAEAPHAG